MQLQSCSGSTLVLIVIMLVVVATGCSDAATLGDSPRPTTVPGVPGSTGVGNGDAERGRSLFVGEGCNACHRTTGQRLVGPGLAGISERGDDGYIRLSIREPGSYVVDGFQNVMTDFSGLDSQAVEDLLAYLKTLDQPG